jgi:choline dehydrogenase-like flavoprotein
MGVVVKTPPINTVKLAKSDEARASAQSHGVAIETPPVHLGIFGLLLPWNSGLELKIQALSYENNAVFIGISRDHTIQSNRVTIDGEGNPVIYYRTSNEDKQMLLAGLEAQVRMMYKAGARYIQIGHANYPMLFTNTKNSDIELEGYIHQLWQEGIVENRMSIFSAHQMSSCRMASTPQDGPTSPSGELYECRNLFIADGSVLPTSLGINPMITIEAFSHMISKNVIKKLQQMK